MFGKSCNAHSIAFNTIYSLIFLTSCKFMSSQVKSEGGIAEHLSNCVSCHQADDRLGNELKSTASLQEIVPFMNKYIYDEMVSRTELPESAISELASFREERRGALNTAYLRTSCGQTGSGVFPQFRTDESLLALELKMLLDAGMMNILSPGERPWQGAAQIATQGNPAGYPAKLHSNKRHPNMEMMQLMGYNSDGAREFPWQFSAGVDISPNVKVEKYFALPANITLGHKTKISHPEEFSAPTMSLNIVGPQLGWRFPAGSLFTEILKVSNGELSIPFEVRIRRKIADGLWVFDVLRPFSSVTDYNQRVKEICESEGRGDCQQYQINSTHVTSQPVNSVINKQTFNTRRWSPFEINNQASRVVQKAAAVTSLPGLPVNLVQKLLQQTPFKSVYGQSWAVSRDGLAGWAPNNNVQDFHIVPRNYFAAFIPMTRVGCSNCHANAGRHVEFFDPENFYHPAPNDADRIRTWYGFLPGDDGIFSFHPFSQKAIDSSAIIYSTASESAFRPEVLSECLKPLLSFTDKISQLEIGDTNKADDSQRPIAPPNGSTNPGSENPRQDQNQLVQDSDSDGVDDARDVCKRSRAGAKVRTNPSVIYLGCADDDIVTD